MGARKIVKVVISISYKMIVFALIVMLINYVGRAAFGFGKDIFNEQPFETPGQGKTVIVDIPEKPSIMQVAKILEKSGAIEDSKLFYIQAILSNYAKKFVGGKYEVRSDMTPTEIMSVITADYIEEETKKE